ncbi:MAG: FadR family transcriptional regulator [Paenibacillaceae bacterium]|nr:FadR family transcriptional regulator [Paenibacillaceae bacterium]
MKKPTLVEIVTERIKTYIVENGMNAGDKLPSEKDLVEMVGVSRTVVREALKSLQLVNIVRIKSGDGIYVEDPSLRSVVDHLSFRWKINPVRQNELLETRIVLELGAIDMAIRHYNPLYIDEMERWNDKIRIALTENRIPDDEDLGFHHTLFKATGNETYAQLSEVLQDFFPPASDGQFGRTMEEILRDNLTIPEEHADILHWLRQKNTAKAKKSMKAHLMGLYRFMR